MNKICYIYYNANSQEKEGRVIPLNTLNIYEAKVIFHIYYSIQNMQIDNVHILNTYYLDNQTKFGTENIVSIYRILVIPLSLCDKILRPIFSF